MGLFLLKHKKMLAVLLTLALILMFVAVPAFSAATYRSLTAPTVPDSKDQKLGTIIIKIDPLVETLHNALVEVEDGWDINTITWKDVIVDEVDDPAQVRFLINNIPYGLNEAIKINNDFFTLGLDTSALTGSSIEIRIEFTSVDIEDAGPIRAYFTGLEGQFVDGHILIGRGQAGKLLLSVREYDHFSEEGNVKIRVTEDVYRTFNASDVLTLSLPRGFEWNEALNWDVQPVYGAGLKTEDIRVSVDGRNLDITFSITASRSSIELQLGDARELAIQVADPSRAEKGDVFAEIKGDYDTIPGDKIKIGFYGDYEYTITPEKAKTVYAGRVKQDIANISLEEKVSGKFILGRSVIFLLPDWAKWGDLPTRVSDGEVELELRLFYGRDGREAVYRVVEAGDADPRELEFEDMEIVLAPNAPVGEDVVVSIAGSAGVRGKPVVATVAAPAEVVVEPGADNVIGIGRSNQNVGTITITETEAGMFKEGSTIQLMLDQGVYWTPGINVRVTRGDINLGSPTGAGTQLLSIRVDSESEVTSTIRITGSVTTLRTIPEGSTLVRLRGPAVLETQDMGALADQWGAAEDGWFQIDGKDLVRSYNVWPDQTNAVVRVLASVGVAAPPIEDPKTDTIMMWIGSTTYSINGMEGEMDVAPFIENDRTFVPVRFITEALGAAADWGPQDALTAWVTLTRSDMSVTLTIGSNIILVTDGGMTYTVKSDAAAQIVNDRTFLPARAVGEIFGSRFDWGPKDRMTEWIRFNL